MRVGGAQNWREVAWAALRMVGLALLKACAFIAWIALSGLNIILRHIEESLKQWLFPKENE
jgi:hypothetical protein